jgi:hypothetical protein
VLSYRGSDMQWLEQFAPTQAEQTMQRTLAGKAVVYAGALAGGLPITLQATESMGWLDRSVVDQIVDLAAVPAANYALEINGVTYNVVFRHMDAPAVDLKPLWPHSDWLIGELKFLTV